MSWLLTILNLFFSFDHSIIFFRSSFVIKELLLCLKIFFFPEGYSSLIRLKRLFRIQRRSDLREFLVYVSRCCFSGPVCHLNFDLKYYFGGETFYSLLVTRYFWHVTCYFLLVTRYLLLVTCYVLLVTFYSLLVTFYSLLITFNSLLFTPYLLLLTCYSLLLTRYSLRFIRTVLHYIHNVHIKLYICSWKRKYKP